MCSIFRRQEVKQKLIAAPVPRSIGLMNLISRTKIYMPGNFCAELCISTSEEGGLWHIMARNFNMLLDRMKFTTCMASQKLVTKIKVGPALSGAATPSERTV